MMVTKEAALTTSRFEHKTAKNADGTPVRCRANGRCKVWVTRPNDYRLPVKHGMYNCFYITPDNASEWRAAA
jgi:hypothetical protein